MGMGRAAERIKILKCPTAASRPLKLGVTSRKNFHRRQEHTTDQNAECDVVESVREPLYSSFCCAVGRPALASGIRRRKMLDGRALRPLAALTILRRRGPSPGRAFVFHGCVEFNPSDLNSHGSTGVHRTKPRIAPSSKTVIGCQLTAFDAGG
jgi:hypothetical protein